MPAKTFWFAGADRRQRRDGAVVGQFEICYVVTLLPMPSRSSIAMLDISGHIGNMSDSKRPSRPRDPNQLAKLITDIATGDVDDRPTTEDGRDLAAVMLGRLGGLKGGKARAASMTSERRSEIARKAAETRWSAKRG